MLRSDLATSTQDAPEPPARASEPEVASGASPPVVWPWWQRVAFRYVFCHCLLYSLPRPISLLLQLLADGVRWLCTATGLDPSLEVLTWPGRAAASMAHADQWWETATSWLQTHTLLPFEVIHQPTGSGDTGHDYARLGLIVAASLVLTMLWTLAVRSRAGYPRLGRWLHLFARWDLAFWLLTYGLMKFYYGQFGEPSLSRLTEEVGELSPMGLVWTFMGAAKPYEWFGGGAEVLGGLLLFHRRTALLGCFVSIGAARLFRLDRRHDERGGAQLALRRAGQAVLRTPAALRGVPDGSLSGPVVGAVRQQQALAAGRSGGRQAALVGLATGLVRLALGGGPSRHYALRQLQAMAAMGQSNQKPELYGIWDVETMALDGVEVPTENATRWKFLAIDRGGLGWATPAYGAELAFRYVEDLAADQVRMKPRGGGKQETWACERGTKTVRVVDPEPKRPNAFPRKVAVARRTLVLRGTWDAKQLELHTVERVSRLQRGFHFIQELPYNR